MESKDTVLPYLQVSNQIPMTLLEFIEKLERQAEISFKAGIEEVVEYLTPFTVEAPMAGKQLGQFIIYLERPDWRAKLSKWGIHPKQ